MLKSLPLWTNELCSVDAKSTEEAKRAIETEAAAVVQGVVGRLVFSYSEPNS